MTRAHRDPWGPTIFVAVACLLAAACSRESPPPAASTPAAPAPAPAPSLPGPKLYVSDETGGAVIVIDAATGQIVERIVVGKRPRGIRVSRDGASLFVALSGSPIAGPGVDESKLPPADRDADGIGVVDLATRKLVRTLKSGQDPEAFDLSPDGTTMYVSNEETAEMSVLDISSGTVRDHVKVGEEPEGVTVRPDGRVKRHRLARTDAATRGPPRTQARPARAAARRPRALPSSRTPTPPCSPACRSMSRS